MINDKIKQLVKYYYWDKDINCARTILASLGELFNTPISKDVMQAAIGLHGAGGYRAQCGLVEGSLMFIGIHLANSGKTDSEISAMCYRFADAFTNEFKSLLCYDLRPNGFTKNDQPHACEQLTVKAVSFAYNFINSNTGSTSL